MAQDHGALARLGAGTRAGRINPARRVDVGFTHLRRASAAVGADALKPVKNALSDYYLVQYRDASGRAVMSVAVSSLATDVSIVGDRLVFPPAHGNEFFATRIPPQASDGVPFSPERAAVLAHDISGALVSGVPEPIQFGATSSRARGGPQYSMWHVRMDQDVLFATEGGDAARHARDLYFDHLGRPLLARLDQLVDVQILLGSEQRGAAPAHGRLTRLPSMPLEFDRIAGIVRQ